MNNDEAQQTGAETNTSAPDTEQLARLLEDPGVRERLADVLREELAGQGTTPRLRHRLGPLIASIGSALVMILAFFIPSIQDQWDRFQSRHVIQRHVELGRSFMEEGKYKLAEASFAKAFELSENKRLDINEERLRAKVQEMNEDPLWGVKNPEGLEEADFLYLLQLQREPHQSRERAVTLNCYGVFLAAAKRWREAEDQFHAAIRLSPEDHSVHVNLGNLYRDRSQLKDAEAEYRAAIRLHENDGRIHYDLGLVLAETNRPREAEEAFRRATTLDSTDLDLLRALSEQLEKNGKPGEARTVLAQLLALEPTDKQAREQLGRLQQHKPLVHPPTRRN